MIRLLTRRLLVRGAAIGVASGIAWTFLVAPKRAALDELRALHELRRGEIETGVAGMDATGLEASRLQLLGYAKAFQRADRAIEDAGTFQQDIRQLAEGCGVRLTRITPRRSASNNASDPTTDNVGGVTAHTVGITLDVVGEFASVAAFIEQIQSGLGFGKVESFRIVEAGSTGDTQQVRAVVRSSHLAIEGDLLAGLDTEEAAP